MTHSPLTRSGVLTDILGRRGSVTEIARKHGVPKTYVRELAKAEAIDLPDGRLRHGEHHLKAIADGYAAGRRAREIAAELGCTEHVVRWLASQIGVSKSAAADHRRGFAVPDHLRADYRLLRRKRLTATEAGEALGLIQRKVA
jgi:transposase-like protein